MGMNIRREWLEDATTYSADFALQCQRCPREIVIDRMTFRAIASMWNLGKSQRDIERRLRCTACGARRARLVYARQGRPEALKLREGDEMPPKVRGLSITRWLLMPNSERKRYKRSLRS